MTFSEGSWRKALLLAAGGAGAFWIANLAISLTPFAAEYRAALSISYLPMVTEALLGGLVIGFGVSYVLLRFFARVPTRGPLSKSMIVSLLALIAVTAMIEVPAKFGSAGPDPWRYFLMATAFNIVRIAALGVAVGYLYTRVNTSVRRK
jgi:hypothetical protein